MISLINRLLRVALATSSQQTKRIVHELSGWLVIRVIEWDHNPRSC